MLQKLKESVELKFGRKISYQRDCKELASSVLSTTSMVVSPSTLRRFFGFLSTNSNPSLATLDILSIYCGYTSWDAYKDSNTSTESLGEPIMDVWLRAKNQAKQISDKNIEAIKRQKPVGFYKTSIRDFASERLSVFLNSSYAAIPFIGPQGFGKTALLVHWYEKHSNTERNRNDIVLCLPSSALEVWIGKEVYIEEWISTILGFNSFVFFDSFRKNPEITPGKFILVLDALDDLTLSLSKKEKIYNAIHQLLIDLPSDWFKLIVSCRYSSWDHFIKLSPSNKSWYLEEIENLSVNQTNIPPLNENEIQKILDQTVNTKNTQRIIVEEFSKELLQIITYPYFLQIFTELLNKSESTIFPDRIDLIAEFIRKELVQKQFSDEKFDILNKIIELSIKEISQLSIKKNDLKEIYPIHLKLSGNYYNAYEQLISFGIVTEEQEENQFGIITNRVRIFQQNIYNYLYLLKIIDIHGGISYKLFNDIEVKFKNSVILPDLLGLLFELANKHKNTDALRPLFTLSNYTIEKLLELSIFHQTISSNEILQKELVKEYLNDPKARKYILSSIIDVNSISSASQSLLENYLHNAETENEKFISNTLVNISKSYSLNFDWIENFPQQTPDLNSVRNISPAITGLGCACITIHKYYSLGRVDEDIEKAISKYHTQFSQNWSEKEHNVFELYLVFALLITKSYGIAYNRLSSLFKSKNKNEFTCEEKALRIYYEFAKWRVTSEFDHESMKELESFLSDTPFWISHQTYIIAKSWLAMYEFTNGRIENAYSLYRNAIEMSGIAGYKILELKLLKNLSSILSSIGEDEKAEECNVFVMSLAEKSKVRFDLL